MLLQQLIRNFCKFTYNCKVGKSRQVLGSALAVLHILLIHSYPLFESLVHVGQSLPVMPVSTATRARVTSCRSSMVPELWLGEQLHPIRAFRPEPSARRCLLFQWSPAHVTSLLVER